MQNDTSSMYKKFERGSKWRRWDLHIHTPGTALNDQFKVKSGEDKWEVFISKIEKNTEIKVVGITDYMSIDNYLKVLKYKEKGRLQNIDLILPNIEFRLTPQTSKNKALNLHIIIKQCNEEEVVKVKDNLNSLIINFQDNPYYCNRRSLIELGMNSLGQGKTQESYYREGVNQFKVSLDAFKKWYSTNSWLNQNSLIAISNSSNDGASGLSSDSGFYETRKDFYHFSNIIFSGNPSDKEYFLGLGIDSAQKVIQDCGSLKPCIHGSDAHNFEKMFKPDQDRYCWIKADTTFEGLKQVVYEPGERVRIQKDNPLCELPDRYFSGISLQSSSIFTGQSIQFTKQDIPLNKNMVAIIGGRGSGKSILLDGILNTLKPERSEKRRFTAKDLQFGITYSRHDANEMVYQINQQDNALDYLHVDQGQVKNIAETPNALNEEIKKLLGIKETDIKNTPDNSEISRLIEEIKKQEYFLNERNENSELKHTKAFYEGVIARYQQLINTITNVKNKEAIENYTANKSEIIKIEHLLDELGDLRSSINSSINNINTGIEAMNKKLIEVQVMENNINTFSSENQNQSINKIKRLLDNKKDYLEGKNNLLQTELGEKGIKEDISTLFEKVSLYQQEIESAENLIEKIDATELAKKQNK